MGALAFYKPMEGFYLFWYISTTIVIEIGRVIVVALFKKREGAWIIGLAFLVFLIFFSFETLMDMGLHVPFMEMRNQYAFGPIGFSIAMSLYLSRDFARTNKRLAEQELEQKLLEAKMRANQKSLKTPVSFNSRCCRKSCRNYHISKLVYS
ncbi:hypothetical protein JW960_28015 [candidate division KSB1 bacterium]|nr:hypothetical protein [candidate division KSB1 bacterium]